MSSLIAAEGGWQDFTLKGGEWAVLLLSVAAALLRDHGFRLREDKTRVQRRGGAQRVLGLVVNDRLGVPRSRRRTLHEEAPFVCISCGKPFATQSSLDRVLATLGKRGILQDEAARRRLRMCADCRVADLMRSGGAN